MLATILFEFLAAGGMAMLGWWLWFDEDAAAPVMELPQQQCVLLSHRSRSAA